MGEEIVQYQYIFKFDDDQSVLEYEININPKTSTLANPLPEILPAWTELEFCRCPNCPLDSKQHKACPAAVNIAVIVDNCNTIISHKAVELHVVSSKRTVTAKTTVQRALSSLLGLLLATSDCPRTRFFKPMAYFHLPLASQDETIFRAISTYFLAKYFHGMKTEPFDLDALYEIYTNMQMVNEHLIKRLRTCTSGDATKNAVVLLHLLSCVLPMSLEESLDNLRPLFKDLL